MVLRALYMPGNCSATALRDTPGLRYTRFTLNQLNSSPIDDPGGGSGDPGLIGPLGHSLKRQETKHTLVGRRDGSVIEKACGHHYSPVIPATQEG